MIYAPIVSVGAFIYLFNGITMFVKLTCEEL